MLYIGYFSKAENKPPMESKQNFLIVFFSDICICSETSRVKLDTSYKIHHKYFNVLNNGLQSVWRGFIFEKINFANN